MEIAQIHAIYDSYYRPKHHDEQPRRRKSEGRFIVGECQYEGTIVYEYTSTGILIPVHVLRRMQ